MALNESNKRKSCDEIITLTEDVEIQPTSEPEVKKSKTEQHNLENQQEIVEIINLETENINNALETVTENKQDVIEIINLDPDNKTDISENPIGNNHEQSFETVDLISETTATAVESDGEIIEETETVPKDIPFCINIKFKDNSIADLYREKFIRFINNFIELTAKTNDDLTIDVVKDDSIIPAEWSVIDDDSIIVDSDSIKDTPTKKRKKSKAKKELFVVDNTPSSENTKINLKYTSKFTINTEKNEEDENDIKPSQPTCFNCDQNHQLKDCTLPKNYERINQARQRLRPHNKNSRYHLEDDQKYGNLVPGKLSKELRTALGLSRDEIPRHVYLMRKVGYPPGWLEEARVVHSNLDMFDIDGKNVKSKQTKKSGLDPDKIIDYPGFTSPLDGLRDEYRRHGVPPYSSSFSKSSLVDNYKRMFEDDLESQDMEIDQDKDDSSPQTKKDEEIDDDSQPEVEPCPDSPSLIDLEQQKKELLSELNDKSDSNEPEIEKEFMAVKTTCFGTPILKSSSPYMTLPNPDNFSKDVSPVIAFENLPNSTGKYEQMTDVLQKVRTTLKKLQNT